MQPFGSMLPPLGQGQGSHHCDKSRAMIRRVHKYFELWITQHPEFEIVSVLILFVQS